MVNALLAELDGIGDRRGVVVIGACNAVDGVDPAILRAGRMEKVIPVHLPDIQGIAEILRVHLGQDMAGADLCAVARLALGMSGADLKKAVRQARRSARTARRAVLAGDVLIAVAEARGLDLVASRSFLFH